MAVEINGDGIEDISNEMVKNAPDVSEHVINDTETEEHEEQFTSVTRDSEGTVFNSEIHSTDENGRPTYKADGTFKKKRGRKKVLGIESPKQAQQIADQKISVVDQGVMMANLIFLAGIAVGGEEFAPRVDPSTGTDEKLLMTKACSDFLAAKNLDDIPPGWLLLATIGMYAAPRMAMPKTQTRLQRLGKWISGLFGRRKKNAPADNRRDNERQNDASKETSGKSS